MSTRLILFVVLPAGLLGIAAAVVVWLPGADDLSMPRLLAGGAVLVVVQAAACAALGYVLGRRGVLR
ncbi:hypothetical protein [Streptomyces sp. CB03238]|uniref:hypothetical protein n=1 Tax=Streptomyces sp. CB03238 TaxID=1907777 RepID=UPI000A0F8B98|nr:hypothetical protein [Streptomyces sp. CB03238]ORT54655.1 hypothetical protein BKD26_34760 [Streptomyces sp. CB03238]